MLSSKSAVCDITASSKIPLVGPFFVLVVLNKLILGRNELDKACFLTWHGFLQILKI